MASPEAPDFSNAGGVPALPTIALWGDSHAKMLRDPVRSLTENQGTVTTLHTLGGCPPIPGFDNTWRNLVGSGCARHNAQVFDTLMALPDATTIIVASRWANYLRAPSHYNHFGQAVSLASRSIFPARQTVWTSDVSEAAMLSLRETLAALANRGHRVIVMGSVPVQQYNAVNMAYLLRGDEARITARSLDTTDHARNNATAQKVLAGATRGLDGVVLRDVAEVMCGPEKCNVLEDGRIIYTDTNHVNGWGALRVIHHLFDGTPD